MINYKSHTKIVATIGPATSSLKVLEEIIKEGIDVCRLNFSHGSHKDHKTVIDNVNRLNKKLNTSVALLADLQGPKIRIGDVKNNKVILEEGKEIEIVNNECIGDKEKLYISYKDFASDVNPGDNVLIDDGKLNLKVIETNCKDKVKLRIINGGILSSKKGVNLPNTKISTPSLTEKDLKDLYFALEQDVHWVALSFVRSVTDIVDIKEIIKKQKKNARVIAKIEKPQALDEIDNIIDLTDGIMIARGDLGVEIPFNQVPVIQKQIVQKCIEQSKPVIIATQMMESMITNFRPTRAEANDVANAVHDGADALMLSGETSVGKYPVEVIKSMQNIITYTEENFYRYYREHRPIDFTRTFMPDSICLSASGLAEQSNAEAIVTFTQSGYTTYKIASYRPSSQIFAFTSNKKILCKLSLVWGVRAYYFDEYDNIDDAINFTLEFLKEKGFLNHEDVVVHAGSMPLYKKGQTNMLKISYV